MSCVYWGVESADNDVLRFLGKPQSEEVLFKARSILEKNRIPYAIIAMCGIQGISCDTYDLHNHVANTCGFINDSDCKKVYISKLQIIRGTSLYKSMKNNAFVPMNPSDIDVEYRVMIGNINKDVNGSYGNQFVM